MITAASKTPPSAAPTPRPTVAPVDKPPWVLPVEEKSELAELVELAMLVYESDPVDAVGALVWLGEELAVELEADSRSDA
jgi:hypothetical protein